MQRWRSHTVPQANIQAAKTNTTGDCARMCVCVCTSFAAFVLLYANKRKVNFLAFHLSEATAIETTMRFCCNCIYYFILFY